jgi:hypothetical protein
MLVEAVFQNDQQPDVSEMLAASRKTITVVKATQVPGPISDSFELLLQVAETGRHLRLPISRISETPGIRYEYENLEYVTANGSMLSTQRRFVSLETKKMVQAFFDQQLGRPCGQNLRVR